jgi:hypothetical protein
MWRLSLTRNRRIRGRKLVSIAFLYNVTSPREIDPLIRTQLRNSTKPAAISAISNGSTQQFPSQELVAPMIPLSEIAADHIANEGPTISFSFGGRKDITKGYPSTEIVASEQLRRQLYPVSTISKSASPALSFSQQSSDNRLPNSVLSRSTDEEIISHWSLLMKLHSILKRLLPTFCIAGLEGMHSIYYLQLLVATSLHEANALPSANTTRTKNAPTIMRNFPGVRDTLEKSSYKVEDPNLASNIRDAAATIDEIALAMQKLLGKGQNSIQNPHLTPLAPAQHSLDNRTEEDWIRPQNGSGNSSTEPGVSFATMDDYNQHSLAQELVAPMPTSATPRTEVANAEFGSSLVIPPSWYSEGSYEGTLSSYLGSTSMSENLAQTSTVDNFRETPPILSHVPPMAVSYSSFAPPAGCYLTLSQNAHQRPTPNFIPSQFSGEEIRPCPASTTSDATSPASLSTSQQSFDGPPPDSDHSRSSDKHIELSDPENPQTTPEPRSHRGVVLAPPEGDPLSRAFYRLFEALSPLISACAKATDKDSCQEIQSLVSKANCFEVFFEAGASQADRIRMDHTIRNLQTVLRNTKDMLQRMKAKTKIPSVRKEVCQAEISVLKMVTSLMSSVKSFQERCQRTTQGPHKATTSPAQPSSDHRKVEGLEQRQTGSPTALSPSSKANLQSSQNLQASGATEGLIPDDLPFFLASSSATSVDSVAKCSAAAGEDSITASRTLPRPSQLTDAKLKSAMGHVCKVCNKRFSRPSKLRIHMYSHTGQKPFACVHAGCDSQFTQLGSLRRHMSCHTV